MQISSLFQNFKILIYNGKLRF